MRRFFWNWAFGLSLFALFLAFALRRWGGYWHIQQWMGPPLKRPDAGTKEALEKERTPPVLGGIDEDTLKALEAHLRAPKKARPAPR